MARLSALQEGIGPGPDPDAKGSEAEKLAAAYRRRVVKTYFGCGVVTSLVVGFAALLPLVYAHPGTREQGRHDNLRPDAALASVEPGARNLASTGPRVLDLPISRSERANAPFPLSITGSGLLEPVRVVVGDMPEAAWLSRGERQDEHTWLLQPSDLDNLRLDVRAGAPDAFDVTIEVASAAGRTVHSVARVRLLDGPPSLQKAESTGERPAAALAGRLADTKPNAQRPLDTRPQVSVTQRATDATSQKAPPKSDTLASAKSPVVAADAANAGLLLPGSRANRPDGMSALGAVARDADQEGRQLWWKMPLPSWAPFDGRN
jgi:hypothetical protein